MAYASNTYPNLSGGETDFVVSFTYQNQADVKAYWIEGRTKTETPFTWAGSSIRLDTPAEAGSTLYIVRETNITNRAVDYTDNAILTEDDLDADSVQAFDTVQELTDNLEQATNQSNDYTESEAERLDARIDLTNSSFTTGLLQESNERKADVARIDATDNGQNTRLDILEDSTRADARYIHWPLKNGYAEGGETVVYPPYPFESVVSVYLNGIRQTVGLAYEADFAAGSITLAEPLETNDQLVVSLGTEPSTGIVVPFFRSEEATLDFGLVPAQGSVVRYITVTGAQIDDNAAVNPFGAPNVPSHVSWSAWVSNQDTVAVQLCNVSTVDNTVSLPMRAIVTRTPDTSNTQMEAANARY